MGPLEGNQSLTKRYIGHRAVREASTGTGSNAESKDKASLWKYSAEEGAASIGQEVTLPALFVIASKRLLLSSVWPELEAAVYKTTSRLNLK